MLRELIGAAGLGRWAQHAESCALLLLLLLLLRVLLGLLGAAGSGAAGDGLGSASLPPPPVGRTRRHICLRVSMLSLFVCL